MDDAYKEYEKQTKKIEMFKEKIKDLSEDELLIKRKQIRSDEFEACQKIDAIDSEFSDRKPFYSMHDEMVDESIRCRDTTKCAFYGCDQKSDYYVLIGVKNENYGIFVCRDHAMLVYEPMHRNLGSCDVNKLKKDPEVEKKSKNKK